MNMLARSLLTSTLVAGVSLGITAAAEAATPPAHHTTVAVGTVSPTTPAGVAATVARPDEESWHWVQHIADRSTCETEKAITGILDPVMGCFNGGGMGWEFAYWD